MNNNECCIANVLKVITILQDKAEAIDEIPNTCDRPFLGNIIDNGFVFNTRPITLFSSNGNEISFPYTLNGCEGTSSVLRCEKVEGCCVTCRILAPNPECETGFPYIATNSFCTINTECICCLQCLPDTFIPCL